MILLLRVEFIRRGRDSSGVTANEPYNSWAVVILNIEIKGRAQLTRRSLLTGVRLAAQGYETICSQGGNSYQIRKYSAMI